MRARIVAGPLVLFTGSCITAGPYNTPSNYISDWAEPVPAARAMLLPSYAGAYASWQLPPEDPWGRYTKMTLLAALDDAATVGKLPDVRNLALVKRAERAGQQVAQFGLPADSLWMVDLRGPASVAFGNALSHSTYQPVSLVLTFNNWPAPNEMIPTEETLAALVTTRPWLPDPEVVTSSGTRPVFLLDSWRLAYREEEVPDHVIDNRYFLTPADLPDPATLLARGIKRVLYVVEERSDDSLEEDDLQETFLAYQQMGITVVLVDLEDLAPTNTQAATALTLLGPDMWTTLYERHRHFVRPRKTLLTGVELYHRSRGGFGGINARPTHVNFGGVFTSPAHGGG